ncbi:hypothetical protein D9M70_474720 [compost metagenome]
MHEAVEAEAHCENADEAAGDMAGEILCLESIAQLSAEGEIAENGHHGEGRAVEGDLAGGHLVSGGLDQRRHANENDDGKDLEQDPLHRAFDFRIH